MTDQQFKDLVMAMAVETERIAAENKIRVAENDKRALEAEKRFIENEKRAVESKISMDDLKKTVRELSVNLGGIGNSNGSYAEEFFYNSLKKSKKIGKIKFDAISKNVSFSKKGIHDEFDLVLINGNSVGLIETKYKANSEHLKKLITKKPDSFRKLFPEFKEYKFYLGLAAMSFENEKVITEAHDAGVVILKQKGKSLVMDDANMIAY